MNEKKGTTTPVLAPGPQNPVVCDHFDWTWTEWHMATALDLHPRICQGEWNGLACTRPDGHHNPHAAGTAISVVAVWNDPAAGTEDGAV